MRLMAPMKYEDFLARLKASGMMLEVQQICLLHATTLQNLCSADRHGSVIRARTQVWRLMRDKYGKSYPEIGAFFGRDHSTVMRALERGSDKTKPKSKKARP